MLKILFFEIKEKSNIWEYDYIHNEIFPDYDDKIDYFLTLDQVKETKETFDAIVYFCRDPNNYYWGHIPTYEDVLECVKIAKPKIIIQLSDEFYYEDLKNHNQLGKYCDLFLRQYNHLDYEYTDNTIHIPLGYTNGFIKSEIIPNVSERFYNWSHIGNLKSDRYEMIEMFKNIETHCYMYGISISDTVGFYLNSIFVPCGRGNSSLDCFRLYESSICGSIPVVVGSEEEINITFKYEETPPWIFSNSWENAMLICKKLLEDKDELQSIQDRLKAWWNNRIKKIRNEVKKCIKESIIKQKLKGFPSVNFVSIVESKDRREILYDNFERYGIRNITSHIFKKYNDYSHNVTGNNVDYLCPKNHRGPVTSHLKAIKNWYENTDEEYTLFCEDDINFDPVLYWNFTWEEFFDSLPEEWECIQLCVISDNQGYFRDFLNNNRFRSRDWCDWSCCAYLIKRSHAKNLIENYYKDKEFCLEYKGWDLSKRTEEWMIRPTPETIVYTLFYDQKNTVFNFTMFVESINFSSTWTDENYVDSSTHHNFSNVMVMEWWKTKGKYLSLQDISANI